VLARPKWNEGGKSSTYAKAPADEGSRKTEVRSQQSAVGSR